MFAALSLDPLFTAPTLTGAHTGALVVDASTGSTLYQRNPNDAFIPASVMKLIVGSAALDVLGNDFTLNTTVTTDGKTLYLVGGGDVLLEQADVHAAVASVRANGGTYTDLIGDDSRYTGSRYPDGWQIDDLPYDYAAPPSALAFEHNALAITVHPGANVGDTPSFDVEPHGSGIAIVNMAATAAAGTQDTTDVRIAWGAANTLDLTGAIPLGIKEPSEIESTALDPSSVTLAVFAQAFGIAGHLGGAPAGARVLWQHHSMPLPKLAGAMWKPSDNLLAETLLEELGVASTGEGDTRARGIAREQGWLRGIGIDPATLTIADGSGMSSYDRVTPHALVTILQHDWFSSHRATMLDALPVAGESGTLQHIFTGAPLDGNVFAKTGTSNHTRTLAGYVRTSKGIRIFALLVNDWMDSGPESPTRLRAFQETFLRAVASE